MDLSFEFHRALLFRDWPAPLILAGTRSTGMSVPYTTAFLPWNDGISVDVDVSGADFVQTFG